MSTVGFVIVGVVSFGVATILLRSLLARRADVTLKISMPDGSPIVVDTQRIPDFERLLNALGRTEGDPPTVRPRYLVGQCPESVAVGKSFSLLASINVAASPASAELELFDVPSDPNPRIAR
jgi:hypothetical protein